MTFSIAARCEITGMFGVAVTSSSPAVAARCAHARAGVGAVSSQNITDPRLGSAILTMMENGASAIDAINYVTASEPHIEYRQLTAVDASGASFIYSGEYTLGTHTSASAKNVACAGNLLANTEVCSAMVSAFEKSDGHLGDRLIASMQAGLKAGGEAGPIHSAGMYMVDKLEFPVADIRCDWTESCPIENIAKAWTIYKPQLEDYVKRAIDPREAPSYGVPGDE